MSILSMVGLQQTGTVYTPNGTTGAFDVVSTSTLSCRLAHVGTTQRDVAEERAEPAHRRRLLWGPDYTMPDPAQIAISGESGGDRWTVQPETVEAIRGPNGAVVYQRATCVRVLS